MAYSLMLSVCRLARWLCRWEFSCFPSVSEEKYSDGTSIPSKSLQTSHLFINAIYCSQPYWRQQQIHHQNRHHMSNNSAINNTKKEPSIIQKSSFICNNDGLQNLSKLLLGLYPPLPARCTLPACKVTRFFNYHHWTRQ